MLFSFFPLLLQNWRTRKGTNIYKLIHSFQFSSVGQSCLTLWDPMDCSTPGFPVHHQFPELAQTHVHRVGDAIQPSHPLLSPSLWNSETYSWIPILLGRLLVLSYWNPEMNQAKVGLLRPLLPWFMHLRKWDSERTSDLLKVILPPPPSIYHWV